jgi:ABC-type bacteriocin/lantibiotic exporter with double-glycine peptidase domain
MQIIKKIFYLLTPREKKLAGLLLVMMLIMTLLDMIGVASIFPFILILTNSDITETNIIFVKIFEVSKIFGIENSQQFSFFIGILFFLLLFSSIIFKAITTYVQIRFIRMREHSIGKRLVQGYLNQPYSWFLNRNSADFGKTVLSEVSKLTEDGITPLMELISKGMGAIALIILLILADPKLALIVGFFLCAAYGIIFYFAHKFLNRIGKESIISNRLRFSTISEVFSAVKEVKFGGFESAYIKSFSNSAQTFARNQASLLIIGQVPRFAIEVLAFGGILLIMFNLKTQTGSFNHTLPIISLYVFVGYRLMPILQRIYACLTQLSFIGPTTELIYNDLKKLEPLKLKQDERAFFLDKTISLKNIFYNYPNSPRTVLKDININMPARKILGIVGTTGSGKTTLVDIILGLLEPQQGFLEIDGRVVTKNNLRAWQSSVGYVPQHIYLTDDTVAANIAFGEDPKHIKQDALEKASIVANIHDFIVEELPKQYQTIIGERGIRLSGGQRQRIGIARALYHSRSVLILDEATSALDNQTEEIIMNKISNLKKNITIIIIAHRLNTVKNCDIIFKLEKNGSIVKKNFNELTVDNKNFIQD